MNEWCKLKNNTSESDRKSPFFPSKCSCLTHQSDNIQTEQAVDKISLAS